MGWIAKFEHGLFGKFTNGKMFKDIVKTAAVSWHSGDHIATHLLRLMLTFNIVTAVTRPIRSKHYPPNAHTLSPLRLAAFWDTPSGKS